MIAKNTSVVVITSLITALHSFFMTTVCLIMTFRVLSLNNNLYVLYGSREIPSQ
jgi:hypothetical protein